MELIIIPSAVQFVDKLDHAACRAMDQTTKATPRLLLPLHPLSSFSSGWMHSLGIPCPLVYKNTITFPHSHPQPYPGSESLRPVKATGATIHILTAAPLPDLYNTLALLPLLDSLLTSYTPVCPLLRISA